MSDERYISLKTLAEQLGLDRSNARKVVLKLGIRPRKRRTPDSRNQLALMVTEVEAEAILRHREEHGFTATLREIVPDVGVFYIIQLVPEFEPGRIKLGFAADVQDRLAQHRTASPTAKLLKVWPCRRSWELTAIDALTASTCRLILNEVFETDDVSELLSRADAFFALLPQPRARPELSRHSPFADARKP